MDPPFNLCTVLTSECNLCDQAKCSMSKQWKPCVSSQGRSCLLVSARMWVASVAATEGEIGQIFAGLHNVGHIADIIAICIN